MRVASYREDIENLLAEERELSVADFKAVLPDMPMASVYTRIRTLCDSGRLVRVGRGRFLPAHKPVYRQQITSWMREVNDVLLDECVGVDHCIYEQDSNLYVESARNELPGLSECLRKHFRKVIDAGTAKRFPVILEGYIIVGPLVSEAPVLEDTGITVPSLEKRLVDTICRKDASEAYRRREFQRSMEVYPINVSRLGRYAARRGVSEELSRYLSGLDVSRMSMFTSVQRSLASMPVVKAWVFGSFARGEETQESDLDLLVNYDENANISLLDVIRFKLDLEKKIHREVDLVEDGFLKPFAVASAERDKYLIYER